MKEFKKYHDAGLSVIPTNGKIPSVLWENYKDKRPTDQEFDSWDFSRGGAIVSSNGIFCIDLDAKYDESGLIAEWKDLVKSQDPDLLKKLVLQKTINNGFHLIGRCKKPISNQKLTYDAKSKKICIETRGGGGIFVVYPSKGYSLENGTFENIPEISEEDLEILIDSARAVSQKEKKEFEIPKGGLGIKPLTDYNSKHGEEDIISLLIKHGWRRNHKKGDTEYLTRPDKQKGVSASVGAIDGKLWVFSSNTVFDPERSYSPGAVLCFLEYGGFFEDCAKDLFKQGYGVLPDKVQIKPPKPEMKLAPKDDIEEDLIKIRDDKFDKGIWSGWEALRNLYRIAPHQMTIVTGIPSHGKSTFMDQLAVNLATNNKWRFLVFSPESYPLAIHRRNIAEKFLKVKLVGVSDAKIKQASNFIRDHFEFMDCSRDDIGLDDILQKAVEANVNGLIIDPWNELEYDRPSGTSETDHIGQSLRKIRHFSRKNNIHTWILAHPQKQYKDQNGKYQKPSPYDIAGSAHWYNKADNCLVVYRNEQDVPEIHVDKIKFSFFGEKGKATLKYNPAYRGYDDTEENAWDPKTVW